MVGRRGGGFLQFPSTDAFIHSNSKIMYMNFMRIGMAVYISILIGLSHIIESMRVYMA